MWGHKIVESLWGADFAGAIKEAYFQDVFIEWRASQKNIESLENHTFKSALLASSELSGQMKQFIREMKAAPKDRLYRQPRGQRENKNLKAAAKDRAKNPVKGRVFFLANSSCISACLDFADYILAMPGVIHVGAATAADSVYMEAAYTKLPSGGAMMMYPMKAWRNRPRGHNEPYIPRHYWHGDWHDEAGLQRWIRYLAALKQP